MALRTAKVRKDISQNSMDFCPYIMRSQARRNLQKLIPYVPLDSDTFNFSVVLQWIQAKRPHQRSEYGSQDESLPSMIRRVAVTIADPGQAHVEVNAAIPESNRLLLRTPGRRQRGPQVHAR